MAIIRSYKECSRNKLICLQNHIKILMYVYVEWKSVHEIYIYKGKKLETILGTTAAKSCKLMTYPLNGLICTH